MREGVLAGERLRNREPRGVVRSANASSEVAAWHPGLPQPDLHKTKGECNHQHYCYLHGTLPYNHEIKCFARAFRCRRSFHLLSALQYVIIELLFTVLPI